MAPQTPQKNARNKTDREPDLMKEKVYGAKPEYEKLTLIVAANKRVFLHARGWCFDTSNNQLVSVELDAASLDVLGARCTDAREIVQEA